jgi:hypothetical protein
MTKSIRTVLRNGEEIADEVLAMLDAGGPAQRIRQLEEGAGHPVLAVGVTIPFAYPAKDWEASSVISLDGKRVRIVLVSARSPGHGAFTRLVRAIMQAGFVPVVCAPVGPAMPAILKHWGWRESYWEEWTPP